MSHLHTLSTIGIVHYIYLNIDLYHELEKHLLNYSNIEVDLKLSDQVSYRKPYGFYRP